MTDPTDGTESVRPDSGSGESTRPDGTSQPSLEDLTLPERVLVAAVQDPIRGFVVVVLLLFAISFLIALAFVYPLVALAFFLVSVVGVLGVAAYGLLRLRGRDLSPLNRGED